MANMEKLQQAVDRCTTLGNFPESQLDAARHTLVEAERLATLASLQRARSACSNAPRRSDIPGNQDVIIAGSDAARLHMSISSLERVIVQAEAQGIAQDQTVAAREEMAQATLTQALHALDDAEASAAELASDRNLSMLQRAIARAHALGVRERLVRAREVLNDVQRVATEAPVDECSICMEAQVTSAMPCCGRAGSGMRICSACLAMHTERTRSPRCPFCRALLDPAGRDGG